MPLDGALPLETDADLDPLLDRIGDARYVLLGEASHGTHEFYAWRAAITRRLVTEKGFSFVGVEGDWPDCYEVSCAVTGSPGGPGDPVDALAGFDRWPTWMWANTDVAEFTRWLQEHDADLPEEQRVGFYGLDVYSLWDSLRAVQDYLREHEPDHVDAALDAFRCFEPYAEDAQAYARATWLVPTSCESPVVDLLGRLRSAVQDDGPDHDARFNAEQNAFVAAGAEAYYRAMVRGGPESWNVRDQHMADTLDRLVDHHAERLDGPVKAVVWEHNTHVGDARFTDMSAAGMTNIGQIARERHGEDDVVLVGFGSYEGTVLAASAWGDPVRAMTVPPARDGSVEALLHDSLDRDQALFVFPRDDQPDWLRDDRDHRAIGVTYRPEAERWGNYVPTVLGRRYDAFCWFDTTRALEPLPAGGAAPDGSSPAEGEPETFPHGT